ncbi:hypothetical protein [Cupriavidus gilardii]|uniref:Uncharacterized protein n=1 Tax=Cupriavidus gilardii TaxID=82541 RepID=A0ABY4VLI7_9BURK|nr:hypothetical protein [Cupriavidus gilardii]NSX04825.1 hypothetical protein [Cupriavidus gilardii]USE78084.1 hypothetical protein NDR89_03280 [Cupriavidus gilardii]
MMIYAYCWPTGRVHFGMSVPYGAVALARGLSRAVVSLIEATAEDGPDGKGLYIPGVADALTVEAKKSELAAWLGALMWCPSRDVDVVAVGTAVQQASEWR